MTRAKDFLYVTWPLRYYYKWFALSDAHGYAQLCRFFTEEVRQTVEEISLDRVAEEDRASAIKLREDIAARIRQMWDQ